MCTRHHISELTAKFAVSAYRLLRRSRIWAALVLVAFVALNSVLALSPHHLRVGLRRIVELSEQKRLNMAPHSSSGLFAFESPHLIEGFEFPVQEELRAAPPGFEKAVSLLMYYGDIASAHSSKPMKLPESPAALASLLVNEKQRGQCYNEVILFITLLQREGIPARLVDFAGEDGLGGNGHNVAEAWVEPEHKWVMLDPQQAAYCSSSAGVPMSVLELRNMLMRDDDSAKTIRVTQGAGFLVPADRLLGFYKNRIRDVLFLAHNDFYTASRNSWSRTLSNLIQSQSHRFGNRAIAMGRYVDSILTLHVHRYRLVDDLSPVSYHPLFSYTSYRAALAFAAASGVMLMLAAVGGMHRWLCATHRRLHRNFTGSSQPSSP